MRGFGRPTGLSEPLFKTLRPHPPKVMDESIVEPSTWGAKTFSEIKTIGERPGSIVVVPVGSFEQHGNHLPVATDTILVDAVCQDGTDLVADEIPILVTPTLWAGLSPHHLDFGGTVTLEVETMIALLQNVATSILDNDFDALIFVNGHGGNEAILSTAVSKIGHESVAAQVLTITYFQLATPFINNIRESDAGGMAHGGEFETSLMLHLRPDLVRDDLSDATPMDDPYELRGGDLFEGGPLSVYRSFEEYSDAGAVGEPDLASAEKGAILFEGIVEELAVLLKDIHDQNR